MSHKILVSAEEHMKKTLEHVRHEFSGVRTGKASPGLLDSVKVEAYGSTMDLKAVATVSAPEARLLVVQPFDKSTIKAIHKAINEANLGLSPNDDGQVIRIPIPTLTEERRKEMVKMISKFAEEGRVQVRQFRHDANKELKSEEHSGALPADDAKRLTDEAQKLTDRYIGMIDDLLKKKTAEVMEV